MAGLAKSCVESWYDEIKKYDYKYSKFSEETGHFTQLIWAGSKKLGVGLGYAEKDRMHTFICVAHYYPPGNVIGDFKKNVKKLKKSNKPKY